MGRKDSRAVQRSVSGVFIKGSLPENIHDVNPKGPPGPRGLLKDLSN
jgi:hypothetical protein